MNVGHKPKYTLHTYIRREYPNPKNVFTDTANSTNSKPDTSQMSNTSAPYSQSRHTAHTTPNRHHWST